MLVNILRALKIQGQILHLVIILLMSTIFTHTLEVAPLLFKCLVCCAATLIFLVIGQTDQISSMQSALYEICQPSLAEHVQGQAVDQDSGVDEETL